MRGNGEHLGGEFSGENLGLVEVSGGGGLEVGEERVVLTGDERDVVGDTQAAFGEECEGGEVGVGVGDDEAGGAMRGLGVKDAHEAFFNAGRINVVIDDTGGGVF